MASVAALKAALTGTALSVVGALKQLLAADYATSTGEPPPDPTGLFGAGGVAILDDAWASVPGTETALAARIDAIAFPRVGQSDYWGTPSDQAAYDGMRDIVSAVGTSVSAYAANSLTLIKVTAQEYLINAQTFPGQALASFVAASSSRSAAAICPKHILWRAGTTLGVSLSASGASYQTGVAVANIAALALPSFALITPGVPSAGGWGDISTWEMVYITAGASGTINVYRAWRNPTTQDLTLSRAHSAGAYIRSACMGGASTVTRATNVSGLSTRYNVKYNLSTLCPDDASGNSYQEVLRTLYSYKADAFLASMGRHADGWLDDVDPKWLPVWSGSPVANADANNDGVVDYALSSLTAVDPTNYWGAGKDALDAWLMSTFGPGTAYDYAIHASGSAASVATGNIGAELEGCLQDNYVQRTFTKLWGKWHTGKYWSRIGQGYAPRPLIPLIRTYNAAHPCPQTSETSNTCQYDVATNADFRLNWAAAQILGGFAAMPSDSGSGGGVPTVNHFDEMAVDVTDFRAVQYYSAMDGVHVVESSAMSNAQITDLLVPHRKWMGAPLGDFVRLYDPALFTDALNLCPISWRTGTPPSVSRTQCSQTWVSDSFAPNGIGYVVYTQSAHTTSTGGVMLSFSLTGLTAGAVYTLAFWLRSPVDRQLLIALGNGDQHTVFLGPQWLNYPLVFRATAAAMTVGMQFGFQSGALWIGDGLCWRGNAGVIARDFERACLIANCTPEAQTIAVPSGATLIRISGTQDPAVNTGQLVGASLTIPAFDAAILGRLSN